MVIIYDALNVIERNGNQLVFYKSRPFKFTAQYSVSKAFLGFQRKVQCVFTCLTCDLEIETRCLRNVPDSSMPGVCIQVLSKGYLGTSCTLSVCFQAWYRVVQSTTSCRSFKTASLEASLLTPLVSTCQSSLLICLCSLIRQFKHNSVAFIANTQQHTQCVSLNSGR